MSYFYEYVGASSFVEEHGIGLSDGKEAAVVFRWSGQNNEFNSAKEWRDEIKSRVSMLHEMSDQIRFEMRFFRGRDDSVIKDYLSHGKKVVRNEDLSEKFRHIHAQHLIDNSFSNAVYVVMLSSKASTKGKGSSDKIAQRWQSIYQFLLEEFEKIHALFPDASLLSSDEIRLLIERTRNPLQDPRLIDEEYDIAEQLFISKPSLKNGLLELAPGEFCCCGVVYKNPRMQLDWFTFLAQVDIDEIHINHQLVKKDAVSVLNRLSNENTDTKKHLDESRNIDQMGTSLGQAELWREEVSNNDLPVYDNAYYINLYSKDVKKLKSVINDISRFFSRQDGQIIFDASVQYHNYISCILTNSSFSKYRREDHGMSISAMMPFTVYSSGENNPESIRLTSSGQVVGYSPSRLKVGHEFVVAMTGGGKGTDKGIEVLETYPFGLDYYILEYGDTFKWVVEGLGGSYFRIDEKVFPNPLPEYTDRKADPELNKDGLYLDALQSSGTLYGIGFILLNEYREYSSAERSVAEKALNSIYKIERNERRSPTFVDLLESVNKVKDELTNQEQRKAHETIYNNLYNFLDAPSHNAFTKENNMVIHDSLCGIDLKAVPSHMQKYYITFIGLKYAHKAFFSLDKVAKVLFDEVHEPMSIAPEATSRIIRAINRMGRKDGAQSSIITQGMKEIEKIDEEVISSSPVRQLLVRDGKHEEIAAKLDMPEGVLNKWLNFEKDFEDLDFRQGLRTIRGNWHELILTFPKLFLDITTTTRSDRAIKQRIESKSADLFERVEMLNKERSKA